MKKLQRDRKIVRSVRHSLLFANTNKKELLRAFLKNYRYAVKLYVDALWSMHREWDGKKPDKSGKIPHYVLDIKNERYDFPSMVSNVDIENTMSDDIKRMPISARAKACALSQAIGMCKASAEKARRYEYILDNVKHKRQRTEHERMLRERKRPVKPHCDNIRAELRSLCAEVIDNENSKFSFFVRLKSIGMGIPDIVIPTTKTRCDRKFIDLGFKRLSGILVSETDVDFRYEGEIPEIKDGATLGCDQGMKDTLVLSNGVVTPIVDNHGKRVEDLYAKLARKRKGSDAYRRAEIELTNFVNWQVRKTVENFNGSVKRINLEKVVNIRFKKRSCRKMQAWSNPRIVDALKANCEISGVHVHEEPSTYMSQRCSECGLVRKASRKGKTYKCPHCGNEMDADLNAAVNHTADLTPIDWRFRKLKLNRGSGFFWMADGLYSVSDEGEPGVHLDPKTGKPIEDFS